MEKLYEGGTFFEGPRWHDGRWYVSDFYAHEVLAISSGGTAETVLKVPQQPSGTGWMPDGSMLIVSMKDHRVLRRSTGGEVTEHADLSEFATGNLNDMVVGSTGHAYVGNFGFDLMNGGEPAEGNIVRVAPDGATSVEAEDLMFPNGGIITPDGGTLIISESFGGRLTAFDIADDGSLSGRRAWAQVGAEPSWESVETMVAGSTFAPDGCSLDAEGCVWVADAIGGRVCRVREGGEIVEERRDPDGMQIYACMLGGEDRRTLLACAAPSFGEHERAAAREAVLLVSTVDAPKAGLP